jgi:hypothetical protein
MAPVSPAEVVHSVESSDALSAGALGFMPRVLVLTTLPHRRSASYRLERINGRHTLRLSAPRTVGLPYGSYARLLLAYLTTEAVRTKSPEIQLGANPNDLARKLSLSTISGPRGTAHRLRDQLRRLLSMRLDWQTPVGLAPRSSGSAFVAADGPTWFNPLRRLLLRQASWRSHFVLTLEFFQETTPSVVPVDLRAIRQLQRSPLAIDLYVWLTYRMSYLKKPTLIPWQALQVQFGSDYSRLRDFRSHAVRQLEKVIRVYPTVRVSQTDTGLRLFPSRPHVGPAQVPTSRHGPSDMTLDPDGRRSRTA